MRAVITTFAILFGVIAVGNVSAQDEMKSGNGGMSVAEFRDLADSLPKLPGAFRQSVFLARLEISKEPLPRSPHLRDRQGGKSQYSIHTAI